MSVSGTAFAAAVALTSPVEKWATDGTEPDTTGRCRIGRLHREAEKGWTGFARGTARAVWPRTARTARFIKDNNSVDSVDKLNTKRLRFAHSTKLQPFHQLRSHLYVD